MKILIIVLFVAFSLPIIKFVRPRLHLLGFSRPVKMTAEATAAALPKRMRWKPVDDPGRDVRCELNTEQTDAQGRTRGWDYFCTFVQQPAVSPKRVRVGVRVDADKIAHVSWTYELDARFIRH